MDYSILIVLIFLAILFGEFTGMQVTQLVLVQKMKIKTLSQMPGKKFIGFSLEKVSLCYFGSSDWLYFIKVIG